MEWLTGILGSIGGIATSAASGGIFGLIGSGISTIGKYFQAKQAHKQKLEIMEMQMKMKAQEGSWNSMIESLKSEAAASDTYKWVNAIKALYRPFLTTGLVVVTYMLFQDVLGGLGNEQSVIADIFTGAELKEILRYIVYSIVFSTATAIVWWFADRAFAPPGLKNR